MNDRAKAVFDIFFPLMQRMYQAFMRATEGMPTRERRKLWADIAYWTMRGD